VVDAVVTVGVVAEMVEDVASARNTIGTVEEINVIQRTRTILKEKEKGDKTYTYDDESAFISEVHSNGLHVSRFVSSPEDVYFPCCEFESRITNVNGMHHVALFCDTRLDNSTAPDSDYSFLRI
jgi:hypothetical protein